MAFTENKTTPCRFSPLLDKMRQYAQILEAHDLAVTQLTTERPGNIVYEDEHKIAAIPFNDTFK